ncbi:TonB family protein [bacterium]|nr:TonB family protein [bacterium]
MPKSILFAALIAITASSGCVYYNTFFLAKKNYNRAEKKRKEALKKGETTLPSDAKSLYDTSIKKSSKVLTYYPESEYADDALFLIGMCYFHEGEYSKAIQKFDELALSFPESPLNQQAEYYYYLAKYKTGDYINAKRELERIAQEKKLKEAEEAAFMLAEFAYENENYKEALQRYIKFLKEFPNSDKKNKVLIRIGSIYFKEKNYQEAISYLENVEYKNISKDDYFGARMMIADVYIEEKKFDKAYKIYISLLENNIFSAYEGKLYIRLGKFYEAQYDTANAISSYRKAIDRFPRTEDAAYGYFYLGEMQQFLFGNLKEAKAMYDSVSIMAPSSEIAKEALARSANIGKLTSYQTEIDSLGKEASVETQLKLAEMYLFGVGQTDSAINEYKYIVENYPEDKLAPKALYALGWIYLFKKNDPDKATEYFSRILTDYPNSDYTVGAVAFFKQKGVAVDSIGAKTVGFLFAKGEDFYLVYNRLDSALYYYSMVATEFPESKFRPKALLAMADIVGERFGDQDSARKVYSLVREEYEETEYSQFAKAKLGEGRLEVAKAKIPKEERGPKPDTVAYAQEAQVKDTTTEVTWEDLPKAPNPKKRGVLSYPEQEYRSDLEGKRVKLRIRIDPFGKVTEVEILQPTGSPAIDEAIKKAAKETEFDPLEIDISNYNKWFRYEIYITKPEKRI